jgi:hypothetical protein
MRVSGIVLFAVALAVAGAGIVEFPRAEEPGHAERNGLVLSLANAQLDGAHDWALASSGIQARSQPDGVLLFAPAKRAALYSRNLPVFPDTCYRVAIAATPRAGVGTTILDAKLDRTLAPLTPLSSARPGRPLTFSSGDERRIVVAIEGTSGGRTLLQSVRLRRGC